jgi:hypothetical protein
MFIYIIGCISVCIVLWIRIQFWNKQPMTHIYSFYKKGILSEKPINNKFVFLDKITFFKMEDLTTSQINEIYEYMKEIQPSYYKKGNLLGYLKKGYLSIYKENSFIRGCLTSRSVQFKFNNETIDAYNVDFIYADNPYILKCLIQTHEYRKYDISPVSIYSSPTKLKFLVPITNYSIHWIYTKSFNKYKLPLKTRIIQSTQKSLHHVYECFNNFFSCQLIPSVYSLSSLIESKNISIYSIYNPYLIAILFFKNTYELEGDLSIVDWIGTIIVDKDIILKDVISTIIYGIQKTFKIIRIHQISNTPFYSNSFKTTNCYKYVYNYGIYSLQSNLCLFI